MVYWHKACYMLKKIILTHPELEDSHVSINKDSQLWALFASFEHEMIHLETSKVILLREMPLEHLKSFVSYSQTFTSEQKECWT